MAMEVEIRRPVESNALTRLGTAAGGRGLRRRCCAIHDETVVELQHCCVAWIAGEAPGVRPISGLLRGDEASVGLEYMERVELPRAASARQPAAAQRLATSGCSLGVLEQFPGAGTMRTWSPTNGSLWVTESSNFQLPQFSEANPALLGKGLYSAWPRLVRAPAPRRRGRNSSASRFSRRGCGSPPDRAAPPSPRAACPPATG